MGLVDAVNVVFLFQKKRDQKLIDVVVLVLLIDYQDRALRYIARVKRDADPY